MGWLAAQGAIMAIGLFIGLVCSVIGLCHLNLVKRKIILFSPVCQKSPSHRLSAPFAHFAVPRRRTVSLPGSYGHSAYTQNWYFQCGR